MDWKCNFNSTDRQIHYNMYNTMILNDVFEVVKRNYYIHICKFLILRIDEDGQKKKRKGFITRNQKIKNTHIIEIIYEVMVLMNII